MMRAFLLVAVLAACGGKSKPTQTVPAEPAPAEPAAAAPAEPATPAEPAAPAEPAKPDDSVLAQAALAEQYELGKKVYAEKGCAKCHGDKGEGNPKNPPVMGDKALPEDPPKTAKLRKSKFKTAADVLDFTKKQMPLKKGGTLSDDEYAAVTAWILSENKVAIDKKLDAANAASFNLR